MEIHDDNALIIYTDGSGKQRPRRGGYAFILVSTDKTGKEVTYEYYPPGSLGVTNNEMEITACVEALRLVSSPHCPVSPSSYSKIVIFADSQHVIDGVRAAENSWPQSGWMTRENEPVQSPELWKELVRMKRRVGRVEFKKVKGHGRNPYNRRADKLAGEAADMADRSRPGPGLVRRKHSPRATEPGVVEIRGQTEIIRIISVRAISARHHSYRYEVIDEASPDFELVDTAFALNERAAMRGAHTYEIRFGESGKGRWIDEVIREIDES